jgi:hypothetical protein
MEIFMSKPDFHTMSRVELKKYILENRDDNDAFQIYIDRFSSEDNVVFPAAETIEDLKSLPDLHRENLEKIRKRA